MQKLLAPLLGLGLLAAPAVAQDATTDQITECGGLGLFLNSAFATDAMEGAPASQVIHQNGTALFFQSIRLMGETLECAATYEEVYQPMVAQADDVRARLERLANEGVPPTEFETILVDELTTCYTTLGYETLMEVEFRIAQQGVGCDWAQ